MAVAWKIPLMLSFLCTNAVIYIQSFIHTIQSIYTQDVKEARKRNWPSKFHRWRSTPPPIELRQSTKYKGFTVTSQELSVLCCERYLTDEVINLLIIKYCDAANRRLEEELFCMLPSDVSTNFRKSAVHNLYANVNMSTVDLIFLPMHLHGNHWGLLVFDVRDCSIEYDDGFHYPITAFTTGLSRFQPSIWNRSRVQRFRVPMPDQPCSSGSCGVGVVFCVKDFCKGFQTHFTWTFTDAPMLRAQLMIDLLNE